MDDCSLSQLSCNLAHNCCEEAKSLPGQPVLPCPQETSTLISSERVTQVPWGDPGWSRTLGGAGSSSGAITGREWAEEVITKLNCLAKQIHYFIPAQIYEGL